ncbi:MAG: hypothetical protein LBU84_15365 [Prevotella sp.]|jgi:hypothetical protein|nr:hypothetical protein [Prevotella sp.]
MITKFSELVNIPIDVLLIDDRKAGINDARHVYWWLLRQSGYSHMEISRMCDRKRTTIINGIKRINELLLVNDMKITDLVNKTKHLKREYMSRINGTISLIPPTSAAMNERLDIGGIRCEACNGQGGIYIDGRSYNFDPEKGEHYKACEVCRGSGLVRVSASLSWTPDGEVKEEYKQK